MTLPRSKYRCQKCGFHFDRENPGPVICPKCNHNYIDWENAQEVLKIIWRERRQTDAKF